MRSNMLYRRMWYVGKRNIKRMQTINRMLVALLIFVFIILLTNIKQIPIIVNFP